jgi:hypothetical protein
MLKRILPAAAALIILSAPAFGQDFAVTNPTEFQTALTTASSNNQDDVINVTAGTYNISSTLTYNSADGDQGHSLTITGDAASNPVLDGNDANQIMEINTNTTDTHIDPAPDAGGHITISNLILRNGNASSARGGGMTITTSAQNVSLSNLTFTDNSSDDYGGGLHIHTITGGISIIDSVFQNNSGSYGGGAYLTAISGGDVVISRNVFSQNTGDSGGGLYLNGQYSVSTVSDNIFAGNTASSGFSGGGLYTYSHSGGFSEIVNNTFYGNTAGWYGGGAFVQLARDDSQTDIYNNIFRDNTANHSSIDNDGDDLFVMKNSRAQLAVVNLYNNDFSGNADFSTGQSEDFYINNTENYNHASNLQTDPRFVDAAGDDFHLRGDSPMIDSGSEAITLPATDFEGDNRILLDTVDIGADEAQSKSDQNDPIPTVNEWGMIILLLLASLAMATRKKSFF